MHMSLGKKRTEVVGQVGPAAVSVADAVAADVAVIAETNDVAIVVVFSSRPQPRIRWKLGTTPAPL